MELQFYQKILKSNIFDSVRQSVRYASINFGSDRSKDHECDRNNISELIKVIVIAIMGMWRYTNPTRIDTRTYQETRRVSSGE